MATRRQRTDSTLRRNAGRGARGARPLSDTQREAKDERWRTEAGENADKIDKIDRPADAERAREKVFAAALRLLSARSRSEQQLRDKLLAKHWLDASRIDECLARLKELGYVNDREFARNYALSRLQIKPIGRARLGRELLAKQLSREIVEETLDSVFEEVAEDDLLKQAIAKHTRLHGRPADQKGANRLLAYLLRRGFAYDRVARHLRALRAAGDDEWEGRDDDG